MNYWLIAYLASVLITAFLLISIEVGNSNRIYLDTVLGIIGISVIPVGNVFVFIVVAVQSCGHIVIWEKKE
jgi:hypothetical protein